MIIIMIIAIGIIVALIDRKTGGHIKRMTTWQQFFIFFMLFLMLSAVTSKP